ncbi:MAG TPA: serine hydrolase domain-containing protein [Lunatimonas sp.]|nr:serine hydrolase domain-containing protein [Lunatimonas sp.]
MNKTFASAILPLLFLVMSCSPNDPMVAINRLFDNYSGNQPGAALGIIKDGYLVYSKGFGKARIEGDLDVTPSTNFRLASVTKQFTATAILLLKEEGLVNLEWTLTEIFDDFPEYGEKITLTHLLNHSSGIKDYEEFVLDTGVNNQIRDAGVLNIAKEQIEGYFSPGEKYKYSNTAYAILAMVVEKYSGMDFPTFLKERIFDPLKMDSTIAYVRNINWVPKRAYGYDSIGGKWIERDQSPTSAVLGDGGIYSNVEDLYKWDQSLYTTKLLTQESLDLLFGYGRLKNGEEFDYGFGWHLKKTPDGKQVVYHTGSTTSFRNVFYRIPSRNLSVIILTNRNQVREEAMTVWAEKVIELYEGD